MPEEPITPPSAVAICGESLGTLQLNVPRLTKVDHVAKGETRQAGKVEAELPRRMFFRSAARRARIPRTTAHLFFLVAHWA
jgi:hypothetical protein